MGLFSLEPSKTRADYIYQFAASARVPAFVVEKDFWVCWLLGRIFATPALGSGIVFKGGTSLSKVFGVIDRFSEDIDLGLSPASLGWIESHLEDAPSKAARNKRMKIVEAQCAAEIQARFLVELESVVRGTLGPRPGGKEWLAYRLDAGSGSPVILFAYPQAVAPGTYIAPTVKIEFGALTDQRPVEAHWIEPLVAKLAPKSYEDFRAEVLALGLERTFWEKATILHAEHHRPPSQPLRDRFARHYTDFAALWTNPRSRPARGRLDILERVRVHKGRFFGSSWASYETARPGSLKLVPPASRMAELRRDCVAMEPMFMSNPPEFDGVMAILSEAERELNHPSVPAGES
jgi:hypothetical protein